MRTLEVERALCDRIVRHVDSLQGLLPRRFVNIVFAVFGRRWNEIMLKEKYKTLVLTDDLKFSLKCLDTVMLDLVTNDDMPQDVSIKLYADFTTLKTLIS